MWRATREGTVYRLAAWAKWRGVPSVVLMARKFGSWYDVLVRDSVTLRKTPRVCQGLASDGFGEASRKVACRPMHGAPRTNRLKHVVFAAYRRPSFVGETAGIHGFVAVVDAEYVTHVFFVIRICVLVSDLPIG